MQAYKTREVLAYGDMETSTGRVREESVGVKGVRVEVYDFLVGCIGGIDGA